MKLRHWTLVLSLIVTGCAPKVTSNPNALIEQSVAATVAALPKDTPAPIPTAYPSPTPFDLAGLFCEYQFCIGHPIEMAFFDVSAQKNPAAPSTYNQGLLAAFNGNLFIQLIWQLAPGTSDPRFLLDTVLDKQVDSMTGNPDVKLIRNMNVEYAAITTTATPLLPFGGAGAWTCGDRVFAWKVYTPQAENAQSLFDNALARFTCNQ